MPGEQNTTLPPKLVQTKSSRISLKMNEMTQNFAGFLSHAVLHTKQLQGIVLVGLFQVRRAGRNRVFRACTGGALQVRAARILLPLHPFLPPVRTPTLSKRLPMAVPSILNEPMQTRLNSWLATVKKMAVTHQAHRACPGEQNTPSPTKPVQNLSSRFRLKMNGMTPNFAGLLLQAFLHTKTVQRMAPERLF